MYKNIAHDLYKPGMDITAVAGETLTGRRFAALTGDTAGGNAVVRTATVGELPAGVIKYDAAAGELVGLARGNSRVILVDTDGDLGVGQPVTVSEDGKATSMSGSVPDDDNEPGDDNTPAAPVGAIVGYVWQTTDDDSAYVSLR